MKHVNYDPTGYDEAALEQAAEALWFNQTEGRSGALNVTWSSLPEARRRWWRFQALAAVRAYADAIVEVEAGDTLARAERLLADDAIAITLSAASTRPGYQVEVACAVGQAPYTDYANVAVGHGDSLRAAIFAALTQVPATQEVER